jgi:hypothetical protein
MADDRVTVNSRSRKRSVKIRTTREWVFRASFPCCFPTVTVVHRYQHLFVVTVAHPTSAIYSYYSFSRWCRISREMSVIQIHRESKIDSTDYLLYQAPATVNVK